MIKNIVKVRKSYGDTYAMYTCSDEQLARYESADKVPLYLCGMVITACNLEHLIDED